MPDHQAVAREGPFSHLLSVGIGSGAVLIGLAVLGAALFFWEGLSSLLEAWSRPEYSHGYLIPFIALYLLLAGMGDNHIENGRQNWLAVGAVLVGLLVGLLGKLAGVPDILVYGFIFCVGGIAFVAAGVHSGKFLWIPLVYLAFMLPLPNFIYWPLSIELQLISSRLGVSVISLFGVPVYLDGNVIDLGIYQLQVAEACSGLRYLFPLMSFSFLFAVLYRGPVWHRLVLFLSALPITVLMNSFRIGVIGILVDRYGIEQAEGFLHNFEGWIIFIACVGILYLEAVVLQRLVRPHQPIHEMLEFKPRLLIQRLGRFRSLRASRALAISALLILVTGVAWQLAPDRAYTAPHRTPLMLFPPDIGGWRGHRETLDADIERVLGADDYLVADFTGGAAAPVNLLIAYYDSQNRGSGIHSPEVCLPTGGWEVSRWQRFNTGLPTASGQLLTVNRAIIQKGMSRQLVYYWFEQRGRSLTSDYAAKAFTVLDSLTRGRTDGALVRLITPLGEAEAESGADERLLRFLALTLPVLPAHIPG